MLQQRLAGERPKLLGDLAAEARAGSGGRDDDEHATVFSAHSDPPRACSNVECSVLNVQSTNSTLNIHHSTFRLMRRSRHQTAMMSCSLWFRIVPISSMCLSVIF